MKIVFITAPLYDYLADSLLIGLRELLGAGCIDFPRKPMMYGEYPSVYGRGFTIWSKPISDIPQAARDLTDVDVVIYSNYRRQKEIDWRVLVKNENRAPRVVYVDGNDDSSLEPDVRPLFKRELYEKHHDVFPVGFGVPDWLVRPLDLSRKTQIHQTHVQDAEFTSDTAYKFSEEKEYYDDLARSFFGVTMKKAGWDCMRHYEILAAGAVVMFKQYDDKPALCNPQCPHFISYSDKNDFLEITSRLVVDGKPTKEYMRILQAQRDWLLENATCTARARRFIRQIQDYFESRPLVPMPRVRLKSLRCAAIRIFLFKEGVMLRAITFVKQHRAVDWFYYRVFRKVPGVALFISRVIMREKAEEH